MIALLPLLLPLVGFLVVSGIRTMSTAPLHSQSRAPLDTLRRRLTKLLLLSQLRLRSEDALPLFLRTTEQFLFILYLFVAAHAGMAHAMQVQSLAPLALYLFILPMGGDLCISILVRRLPVGTSRALFPIALPFLLLTLPLSFAFLTVYRWTTPKRRLLLSAPRIRDKIEQLLQETELSTHLDPREQKLLLALVSFKERIVREVMVPRINMFSLSESSPLQEALEAFFKERYSRIPVYRESADNVVGVLLYKDVLEAYVQHIKTGSAKAAHIPITALVKPAIYAPETKKISELLQEFRTRHIHLAIVVDEYGGTEGIVTFEDVLEELVGEIADEYDVGEEALYLPLPSGGWVVDASMSIVDVEEELGVKIPSAPEYDTLGGYIFHRAGSVPHKGWCIHHDEFDLEVLTSDERSVGKIRITPHLQKNTP